MDKKDLEEKLYLLNKNLNKLIIITSNAGCVVNKIKHIKELNEVVSEISKHLKQIKVPDVLMIMDKKEDLEIFIKRLKKTKKDIKLLADPEKNRHISSIDCLNIMQLVWQIKGILEDIHLKNN